MSSDYVITFPTLGDLVDAWIEQHCRVPDGFARRRPFKMADWQFWCAANHYRIRESAEWNGDHPLINQAFYYRRSQIVAPQKTGKGPWAAVITCVEAVGPSVFGGWATQGEVYDCAENGCSCGWSFKYAVGEPKGIRHPSPLIQLTATSEDQVDNVYRPLTAMIKMGPLGELMKVREGFIRIVGAGEDPDLDRIDVVTASASSRLGNPISFALQDETGLYTEMNKMRRVAETQRRGAAGMSGRTIETTNAWDPSENSVAQTTYVSKRADIFKYFRMPPADLVYSDKKQRRKIHEYVYEGCWWVDLDSIEGEAAELLEQDPAQAERFFGNRVSIARDAWQDPRHWQDLASTEQLAQGDEIALGFDGSRFDDSTALVAVRVSDGFTTLVACWEKPEGPEGNGWEVPRGAVDTVVRGMFRRYSVRRFNCDPPYWEDQLAAWHADFGDVVREFWTSQPALMGKAVIAAENAMRGRDLCHDGSAVLAAHIGNARRRVDRGWPVLRKDRKGSARKIDAAVAWVLAWQGRLQVLGTVDVAVPDKEYAFTSW